MFYTKGENRFRTYDYHSNKAFCSDLLLGMKHHLTFGILSLKQQPLSLHSLSLIPGQPQSVIADGLTLQTPGKENKRFTIFALKIKLCCFRQTDFKKTAFYMPQKFFGRRCRGSLD